MHSSSWLRGRASHHRLVIMTICALWCHKTQKASTFKVKGPCFHRLIVPEWAGGALQNPLSSSYQELHSPVELCSAGRLVCRIPATIRLACVDGKLGNRRAHSARTACPPDNNHSHLRSIGPSPLFAIHSSSDPHPFIFPTPIGAHLLSCKQCVYLGPNCTSPSPCVAGCQLSRCNKQSQSQSQSPLWTLSHFNLLATP